MSSGFDARKDSEALRLATEAFSDAFLKVVMPDLRLAAKGCGYALAVHGTRARDIDMIAVPWVEGADEPDFLVQRLCGVLSGKVGRSVRQSAEWADKPHGRKAVTIFLAGSMTPEIDLSIVPQTKKAKK